MSEPLYWGCYDCGHKVPLDAIECWECEEPKQFFWLNSLGEHPTKKELSEQRT